MKKILITGATGNIAGVTLPHLLSSAADVRALIRDESKAEELKALGVEVVIGDLSQPQTLDAAFDGVDKVLLIIPVAPNAVELGHNALAAAQRSGTPHVILVSSNVPEPVNETEVGRQSIITEAELENAGIPYTIIRPTFFMQNTMMAGQTVAAQGMVYLPCSVGRLGMIDVRDVGAAAAQLLLSDEHEGKTYVLTGPASISISDVASTLSSVLGKEVTYVNVPFEAAKEAMMAMGLPDWMADMYNEMFKNFGQNGADFATADVENITGRQAISYQQFAQDFAGAFSAN